MKTTDQKKPKIESFTDLDAWKEAHKLVVTVYKTFKKFPQVEQYGLSSQLRRSTLSISSNIAEGFSRATKNDKMHFYIMAKASTTEAQDQLLVARDVGYISNEGFQELATQSVIAHKLITGLMRALDNGKGVRK